MKTAEQFTNSTEVHSTFSKVGASALAGILVAGGATLGIAYHDLQRPIGPVFDTHDAETHAMQAPAEVSPTVDPATISPDFQTYQVIL